MFQRTICKWTYPSVRTERVFFQDWEEKNKSPYPSIAFHTEMKEKSTKNHIKRQYKQINSLCIYENAESRATLQLTNKRKKK